MPIRVQYEPSGECVGSKIRDDSVSAATTGASTATSALKVQSTEMTGGAADDPDSWVKNGCGRAMLLRAGWLAGDFLKPVITVAAPWTNGSSCNHHLQHVAQLIAQAIEARGGKAMIVCPPVITDGMAMGHEGMRYSLASRDLIADCIELHHEGHRCDAIISVGGCDKSQPGVLQPILRRNCIGIVTNGGCVCGCRRGWLRACVVACVVACVLLLLCTCCAY